VVGRIAAPSLEDSSALRVCERRQEGHPGGRHGAEPSSSAMGALAREALALTPVSAWQTPNPFTG